VRSRHGGETDADEAEAAKRSERFKRRALARWRLLAASGVSLEQAALEIGVTAVDLRAWSRGLEDEAPLLVPVQVEGEPTERRAIVVLGDGMRIEGLTVAEVAELVRRLS
jgi:hypothetical protein